MPWTFYNSNGEALVQHAESEATKAEMEAETAIAHFAPPDLVKNSPGVAKGWVSYTQTSDTVNASYNLTGISDGGAGTSTITWATDFSTINHCAVAMVRNVAATNEHISMNAAPSVTATSISTAAPDGTRVDMPHYFVAVFGDQ